MERLVKVMERAKGKAVAGIEVMRGPKEEVGKLWE